MLVVALQPANDNSSLGVGQEFGTVREVLDDPKGQEACHDRRETFQYKDPCPARFPANPVHLRDCGLSGGQVNTYSRERTILPTASKPPNAPDIEAAEKKSAARIPNSERLYQLNEG